MAILAAWSRARTVNSPNHTAPHRIVSSWVSGIPRMFLPRIPPACQGGLDGQKHHAAQEEGQGRHHAVDFKEYILFKYLSFFVFVG